MKGFVSKIETSGFVDGPGIRTVVFMDGCKLRCKYCHNPEMWVRGKENYVHHNQYKIDYVISKNHDGKCLNCGADLHGEAKCPYCDSPVSDTYKDFVMSKKSRIS